LTHIAFLISEKGYASYDKIHNDFIEVPFTDNKNHVKRTIKRVRLNVTLQRNPKFFEVIENEKNGKYDKVDVSAHIDFVHNPNIQQQQRPFY
jgi:hypothetical protein